MAVVPASFRLPDTLVRRLATLTAAALLVAAGIHLAQWQAQQDSQLAPTAELVARFLADDLGRRVGAFDRGSIDLRLQALAPLAERLPFCVAVHDIAQRPLADACLPVPEETAWRRHMAALLSTSAAVVRPLILPGGITVGTLAVTPHWQAEADVLLQDWTVYALLLAVALVMVAAVWITARRALRPAALVLHALRRVADGDLSVRLPRQGYDEFDRISMGLNQALDAVATAQSSQRHLAVALLQTREAERRRLARELHDELGQSLAALNAEAAVLQRLLGGRIASADASTQAIALLGARMLDELQRVLADLRPTALDRFGLRLALQALVDQPRPRRSGPALTARLAWHMGEPRPDACPAGSIDDVEPREAPPLPYEGDTHVYRIVQEALTNAWRHGGAAMVDVTVRRDGGRVEVRIEEPGPPGGDAQALTPRDNPQPAAGQRVRQAQGLLGIRERARALGGDAHWSPPTGGGGLGWRVVAYWPLVQPRDATATREEAT